MNSEHSNLSDDRARSDIIQTNAVRSGRPIGPRARQWRVVVAVLGLLAVAIALATTYCLRRVPLREMKPPSSASRSPYPQVDAERRTGVAPPHSRAENLVIARRSR